MSLLRLYSGPLSMFGAKAQIALLEKQLAFELVMVPFDPTRGYEPKHPAVLRINPKGQVPVLVHGELEIFDSTQIFEYLETLKPEPALWPREPEARARARLLEHQSDEVFFPHVITLMRLEDTPVEPAFAAAKVSIADYYEKMEQQLAGREFLAGALSYADIAFYMAQLFAARKTAPMTANTPRLLLWRERMGTRSAVRNVAGAMADYLRGIGRPLPEFMERLC
jgi:glutathione S-transferase